MARKDGKDRGIFERTRGTKAQITAAREALEQAKLLGASGAGELKKKLADLEKSDWWIQYNDSSGKKHREKGGSRTDAKALYQRRKTTVLQGKKLPELGRREITVADLVGRYSAEIQANKKSAAWDERIAKLWVKEIGDIGINSLQSGDIERVKGRWLKTFKPATCNRRLAFLKTLFGKAVRDLLTERNPVASGRVKMMQEESVFQEILYAEVEDRLRQHLNRIDNLAVTIALHTGLRISEQILRQRTDIDLRQACVWIPSAKGGGRQQMALNPTALAAFMELLQSHDSPWAFPNVRGDGSMSRRVLSKHFEIAAAAVGFDGSWHNLRHTYVSRLVMLGIDIITVQHLARHKSLTMTLKYAHLAPDHKTAALNRLAEAYPVTMDTATDPTRPMDTKMDTALKDKS